MIDERYDTTNCTMKETVFITRAELDEQLKSLLATAKLADKKWIWNYFQDHDRWPIVTDEIDSGRAAELSEVPESD
tara:strand:- start:299 stop:526 length:228 start_codon:yes stop_codon:yes gene_type:complete